MKKQLRNAFERAGYVIVTGCVASLIANIAFYSLSSQVAKDAMSNRTATEFSISFGDGDDDKFESSLLIDSILSIVQSYYVDPTRVSNQGMFVHTLESLGLHPDIKLENVSPEEFKLVVDKKDLAITAPKTMSYQQLLTQLVSISAFLEKNLPNADPSTSQTVSFKAENLVLNALLQSLDAHSSLLSQDAYNELRQGTEGSFGGLGVVVGIRDDILTVLRPLPRSPAVRAGIKKLDKIIAIDGKDTYGFTLDQLVEYMRGSPGTAVHLGILRDGDPYPRDFVLTREMIQVDSVMSETVKDGNNQYLWSRIDSFSSHTSEELTSALRNFKKSHHGNIDGMILDLRSNPGGLLDQAIEVANLFIEKGVLVSTKGRRSEIESAHAGPKFDNFPIVVLVNEDSASASEIVAGALQDHQRALIVGQPSFGKGSVQTIFELPGQQALKLTIARYYTPLGKSIQNIGIQPDVWLQPVVAREDNRNLLGMFRYRGERFLRNRLEAKYVDMPLSAKDLMQTFKAYYTLDRDPDDFDDLSMPKEEMSVAKTLLREIRKVYPGALNDSNNRAGHWLALAGPTLKKNLEELSVKTRDWMIKKHQVLWDENSTAIDSKDLNLTFPGRGNVFYAMQGEELTVPWRIRNDSNKPINRISLYATPMVGSMESTEVLVGSLPAKSQKSGVIKVKASRQGQDNHVILRVGVAIDAIPLANMSENLEVVVKKKNMADLSAFASLQEESSEKLVNVLEPEETAKVRIEFRNLSGRAAKGLKAHFKNLSGTQLKMKEELLDLGDLGPGESRYLVVDVRGSNKLFSKALAIGVVVQGDDLKESFKQTFLVNSSKNANADNVYGVFSH